MRNCILLLIIVSPLRFHYSLFYYRLRSSGMTHTCSCSQHYQPLYHLHDVRYSFC